MTQTEAAVRKAIVVDAPVERAFTVFTERFGDFKTYDSLTLPTQWEVRFTEDIPVNVNERSPADLPVEASRPAPAGLFGRSSTKIWTITEDAIINNVSLDPRNFAVK